MDDCQRGSVRCVKLLSCFVKVSNTSDSLMDGVLNEGKTLGIEQPAKTTSTFPFIYDARGAKTSN